MRLVRLIGSAGVAGLALLVASCGDGKVAVYPTSGNVVDAAGKPAVGAMVVFHPKADAGKGVTAVSGVTDDQGVYRLTTFALNDGAPAGEYTITLTWPRPKKTPFDSAGDDLLGGRYGGKDASKLTFTVEAKPANEVPEIKVGAN